MREKKKDWAIDIRWIKGTILSKENIRQQQEGLLPFIERWWVSQWINKNSSLWIIILLQQVMWIPQPKPGRDVIKSSSFVKKRREKTMRLIFIFIIILYIDVDVKVFGEISMIIITRLPALFLSYGRGYLDFHLPRSILDNILSQRSLIIFYSDHIYEYTSIEYTHRYGIELLCGILDSVV